jgi:hypothetical protein
MVEQLQAAQGPDALAAEGHQSNALVARILAESLGGGAGEGPDLDHLITALGGSEAGNSSLAQLAGQPSHAFGSSGWEAADYGGPATVHENFGMEALNLHQDAIPQV